MKPKARGVTLLAGVLMTGAGCAHGPRASGMTPGDGLAFVFLKGLDGQCVVAKDGHTPYFATPKNRQANWSITNLCGSAQTVCIEDLKVEKCFEAEARACTPEIFVPQKPCTEAPAEPGETVRIKARIREGAGRGVYKYTVTLSAGQAFDPRIEIIKPY